MRKARKTDILERDIYAMISAGSGVKASEIARKLGVPRKTVNRYLYASPYMHELCYRDDAYFWHSLIRQGRPHVGLGDFCGYCGTVKEFLGLGEEEWMQSMKDGCGRIGRNLNDTRGLFHSFRDTRKVMCGLFADLREMAGAGSGCTAEAVPGMGDWEICFELRINRAKWIRIYADALVITERYVFELEFKMKDSIEPAELEQAAKYSPYLEVLFGKEYEVIPALVLTRASDLYTYAGLEDTTAQVPVCSGDMLFNLFDEYLNILSN